MTTSTYGHSKRMSGAAGCYCSSLVDSTCDFCSGSRKLSLQEHLTSERPPQTGISPDGNEYVVRRKVNEHANRVIKYTPDLKIQNTKYLAPGLGLRYLECILSHRGDLVAKMWHRDMPVNAEIVVTF